MAASFGKYQLVKKLATGGMADVWLAKQSGMEGFARHVVIKRILPHLAEEPEFVQMFFNEAKIASHFSHPNIAQIYDLGETDGTYYIAMEFVHGEDLGRVMRRAWSTGQWVARHIALRIVADACQGLYYAHSRSDEFGRALKVVHRDVSPQNILISFDGTVKLVDFGIAKAADQVSQTKSGAIKGKFAYMAPEQAGGKPVDARTDLFALGLVLYELITGVRPLKKDNELATLQAALVCDIAAPSQIADVPADIDPIVMQALARDPKDRYRDAREFQKAIEQYLFVTGQLVTNVEVCELMELLFADRLAEESRLGSPSPSVGSSTGNPAVQPPSEESSEELSVTHRSQGFQRPEGAWEDVSESRITLPEGGKPPSISLPPPVDDELGWDAPSGPEEGPERTMAAPPSPPEPSRAEVVEVVPPAPTPKPPRKSGQQRRRVPTPGPPPPSPSPSPSPQRAKARPPSRRQALGDADDELSTASAVAQRMDPEPPPGRRVRAATWLAALGVVAVAALIWGFRAPLSVILRGKPAIAAGVPLRLSVRSVPPTRITVVPPPEARGRQPLDLGPTPIHEQLGAYAGDTVLLVNEAQGIRFETVLEAGPPNAHTIVEKEFKESMVKIRTEPPLADATIWRNDSKLGNTDVNLLMYPGVHHLEIRSDELTEPVACVVSISESERIVTKVIDLRKHLGAAQP